MKALTFAGVGLAALLASAGLSPAKTLVYCSEGSPENFTPAINTTGTSFDAARPVYNRLTEFKRGTTEVVPGLAESWEVADGGKTITFHLRKGVKFHSMKDFKPTRDFNADDVLFSINRQWKPDNPYYKVSGGKYDYFDDMDMAKLLDSVEKTDDYTVVMKLKTPNVAILANLAMDFMAIGSAEYADFLLKKGTPEQFDQAPVGTGPFSFVAYQKDSVIRLQGEQGLLRREAAGRRPRLRHHPRRHRALRQAESRRVPHQRLSAARRPRGDGEGSDAQGDQRARPQHRLLGVQQYQAAVRQEGSAPGSCRWRSTATPSSRTSISARARRRRR